MLEHLTDTELNELELATYRGTMRLYETVEQIHAQMTPMKATWLPEYKALRDQAAMLLAAGREQGDLYSEVSAERRSRMEAASARRLLKQKLASYPVTTVLPARDTSGDMTPAELRAFEATWDAC